MGAIFLCVYLFLFLAAINFGYAFYCKIFKGNKKSVWQIIEEEL